MDETRPDAAADGIRLAGAWLAGAAPVFAALAPRPAYAVGGAVRNALLGEPVADVDIATAATPDEVVARAAAAGPLRADGAGAWHGHRDGGGARL